jgi:hypothetical protein
MFSSTRPPFPSTHPHVLKHTPSVPEYAPACSQAHALRSLVHTQLFPSTHIPFLGTHRSVEKTQGSFLDELRLLLASRWFPSKRCDALKTLALVVSVPNDSYSGLLFCFLVSGHAAYFAATDSQKDSVITPYVFPSHS